MAKKEKPDFESYYRELFGDRWDSLRQALLDDEPHYYELNSGLLQSYFLDPASVEAARALEVKPGQDVLDLCAAPGGKTLFLALALKGSGSLVSNDISPARRGRLRKVLDDHLPTAIRETVEVRGHDASRWGMYEPERYDRILADVPCSSEGHVIRSAVHLKQWSPSRIKSLAHRQFAILASALDALKPGGEMVYSTCALAPDENDGTVAKLFKKRKEQFDVITFDRKQRIGERTLYGIRILPDREGGLGPIYYCVIRKR